jgi:hypothetical protein
VLDEVLDSVSGIGDAGYRRRQAHQRITVWECRPPRLLTPPANHLAPARTHRVGCELHQSFQVGNLRSPAPAASSLLRHRNAFEGKSLVYGVRGDRGHDGLLPVSCELAGGGRECVGKMLAMQALARV